MPTLPTPSDDQWPTSDPLLAAFAEDLRIVASGPAPEPRPALLAVMAQGPVVPPEPPTKRSKVLLRSVVGSLAAKVALGVGVAAASVTAVGATGVLPDQAQHAVASVVSATTPFVLPDPSTARPQVGVDPTNPKGSTTTTSSTISTSTTLVPKTGDDPAGADRADNHGGCVSAVAQDDSGTDSHGKTVSAAARTDCGKTTTSPTVPGSASTSSTSATSTSTTVRGGNATTNGAPGNSGKGNGNGNGGNGNNGNGSGNGGNGNSGKGNGGGSGSSNKG